MDNDSPASESTKLVSLDTSAVDGKLKAYIGIETYFVVYPEPLEAEDNFDVRNTIITYSKDGIIEAVADKNEEYRFGSINVTGLKLGKTTVYPSFGYRLLNFISSAEYIPFLIFMWIAGIINK